MVSSFFVGTITTLDLLFVIFSIKLGVIVLLTDLVVLATKVAFFKIVEFFEISAFTFTFLVVFLIKVAF